MKKYWLAGFLVGVLTFVNSYANEEQKKESNKTPFVDQEVATRHSVKIGGQEVKYTATIGKSVIKDEKGCPKAAMSYVAYQKEGVKNMAERPITFCFNGGPGSSSIWLHIGAYGPRRIALTPDGIPKLPAHVEDNPNSILDITDLVFIDPVSTGYSRPAPDEEAKQFHGVEEDIKSVAEFIRLFVTKNDRWGSPKYISGESYGTTRAAGLTLYLQDEKYMFIDGVALISSVLNFQTFRHANGNDLPCINFLPTYAATAWYYNRIPRTQYPDLEKLLDEVYQFSIGEYAEALMKGDALDKTQFQAIANKLKFYSGLPEEYIKLSNLRINNLRFLEEFFKNEAKLLGRFDTRITGPNTLPSCNGYSYDPSFEFYLSAYTSAFNHYVRSDLRWESDEEYVMLARIKWDFTKATNKFLDVSHDLLESMSKNENLFLFIANGYYDVALPYASTLYTLNHMELNPAQHKRVTLKEYEGGHMMYHNLKNLEKLKSDMKAFYQIRATEQETKKLSITVERKAGASCIG